MMDRAGREAAVRRYAEQAARRKELDVVLAAMDAGNWTGHGLTRDEQTEVQAAGFAAAREVVRRWREDALAQQEMALEEMDDLQTATRMMDPL
jgi:hypothetical protein